jgi:uncharacterized protein (DUF2062 family)
MAVENRLHWWTSPRTLLRYILMLDDTPHSIALGTAIGMFVGLTPTVGIQMVLVLIVAWLTRPFFQFNRVAALVTVYVSNPVTMVPMYWFLYCVGKFFVGGELHRDALEGILHYENFHEWWETVTTLLFDLGWPLLLGTAIVAPLGGLLTYPAMRWLLHNVTGPRTEPNSHQTEPKHAASLSNLELKNRG